MITLQAPMLAVVAASAVAVTVAERMAWVRFSSTATPFTIMGTALAIFLAFRNGSSYDRWWEGRKLWGGIVNASRNLARQVITFSGDEALARDVVYRQIAWVNALRAQLRGADARPAAAPFLGEEELAELSGEHNVAAALIHRTGVTVAAAAGRGLLTEDRLARIDWTLTDLIGLQGGCERIKSTPVPVAYRFFTHRFTRVYCVALPLGVVEHLGVLTVVVVVAMSFMFLVLETVGRLLEDPFVRTPNGLALEAICRTIEINLRQQLGETAVPEQQRAESFMGVAVLY